LTGFTTSKLVLTDNDNGTLVYEYKPSTGQFTRQKNGTTQVLLKQCDLLKFAVYQRTPTNGWRWYPITFGGSNTTATAKLIDVSWKCSRKILGAKVNTESVQPPRCHPQLNLELNPFYENEKQALPKTGRTAACSS